MKSSNLFRAAFTALALAAAACSSTPAKDTDKGADKDKSAQDKPLMPANPFRSDSEQQLAAKEKKLGADGLYRQARLALDSNDFSTAISRYNQIAARFPFTEYSTQADLERVFALYRSFQPDDALTAADKFLKEHPRHPAADYVQYIKALVNTGRDEGLSGTLGLDNTKEDVSYLRRAFDDFSLLAQKYPNSQYAGDARQHMIDLRNRIAQHDLHIVHYYMKRGAFIAAAKRSEQILVQYPGAPATIETMQILEQCYNQMGLKDEASDVHKLLVAQLALPTPQTDYPVAPKKPSLFQRLTGVFKSKPATPAPAALTVAAPVVLTAPGPLATATATGPAMPASESAAPAVSAADAASTTPPAAAAKTDDRSWLRRLFTPGSEEVGGATIVIPTQSAKSNSDAAAKPAAGDAAATATAATPAADAPSGNGLHGNGFSVTMEPYDDGVDAKKKPADQPAASKTAPVAAAPAAPAAQDPAEAPTFSNWLHHLFSSDKKPAEAATTTTTSTSVQPSKPASAADTSTKPADDNKTPTLMDLLYHSVAPDKKDASSTPAADSKPAATP